MSKILLRRVWLLLAVLVALALVGGTLAEEQGKEKKGKGKDKEYSSGRLVTVDLDRLPPDLAKAVMKYAGKGKKEDGIWPKAPKAKDEPKGEGKTVFWAKQVKEKGKSDLKHDWAKGEAKKGKKGDDRAQDLEARLDRLFRELEDLRREIRRK